MKKILATLLVATMLLSCLTFVGFAATADVYTVAKPTFNYTEFNTTTTTIPGIGTFEINASYKDSYTQNYYETIGALNPENPRYKTMVSLFNKEAVAAPANEYTTGDYVALPIYIGGDGVADFNVSFNCNSDYFEYATVKLINTNFTAQMGPTGEYGGMTSSNQTGLLAVAYFAVKDTAKAQKADGTATANVGFTLNNASHTSGTAATASVTTMTVDLSGLDYDAPAEDVYMTENEVKEAATADIAVSKAAYSSDWAPNNMTVVSGDEKDVTVAEAYSAVFATIAVPTGKKVDARGFVLIDAEGNATFYAAKESAINAAGQFGMAFFGTEASLGKYQYAPAAKVDGNVVYDANAAEAL